MPKRKPLSPVDAAAKKMHKFHNKKSNLKTPGSGTRSGLGRKK